MSAPLPPLSLYVHIPWCIRKCPYCDFNSHETQTLPEQDYVAALIEDLQQEADWQQGRSIQSVFFGGGTPSLFKPESFQRILTAVDQTLGLANDAEITMEANPGATEVTSLEGFFKAGINRLSIGVQSFHPQHLASLGRIHSPENAFDTFRAARTAGFNNINLDLMHGLPHQSTEQAMDDLHSAIALAPEHISWYQLTIEPNTVFYSAPPTLPDDDTLDGIFEQGLALLAQAGYAQYEVSAFAKVGKQARHNLNYWTFGDYLAIGAGAHGKITSAEGSIHRYWKTRQPNDYLAHDKPYSAGQKTVPQSEQLVEFMMNALRLVEGVSVETFLERTQLNGALLREALAPLHSQGLLVAPNQRVQTTELGFRFLNSVLTQLQEASNSA